MWVWKHWSDEHRATLKTGNGGRKVIWARDNSNLFRMAVNDRTTSSRQLAARWSTVTGVLISTSPIRRRLLHHGLRINVPLYRISNHGKPSESAMGSWAQSLASWLAQSCFYRWIMLDGSFNVRCYCGKRCLQSAISNDIVAEQSELWSGIRFRIKYNQICYDLRVISTATCTSVKCCSSNSFPSIKTSLEFSFNRIMHAHMLQRLFETSVQPNTCYFFLGLLIRRICRPLSTRGFWLRFLILHPSLAASKDKLR